MFKIKYKRLIRRATKQLNDINELMKYSDIYLPLRDDVKDVKHKKTS